MRTIATTVAPRALRSIRSGHPWVFDGSIRTQKVTPAVGDLAVVFDDRRRFVGIGLADPDSPIAIRMLHHGKPTEIDAGFFRDRVDEALTLRDDLTRSTSTTGYRLLNGENDGLPGLVVDRYADVLVAKLYTPAWLPYLDPILDHLVERFEATAVVLRASRTVQPHLPEGESVVRGTLSSNVVQFAENGLVFSADVVEGNKTGHFLDQRENRQRVRDRSEGARVLDVFSSTGGFSVYAAAGGARAVTSVDISRGALAAATANMKANDAQPVDGHSTRRGDAFEILAELRRGNAQFDIVVIDPPSFAPKKADVPRARAAYRRLTAAAAGLVAAEGLLVQASCSARVGTDDFVADVRTELERSGRSVSEFETFGHPSDHPVTFDEGRYLKAVFARLV